MRSEGTSCRKRGLIVRRRSTERTPVQQYKTPRTHRARVRVRTSTAIVESVVVARIHFHFTTHARAQVHTLHADRGAADDVYCVFAIAHTHANAQYTLGI